MFSAEQLALISSSLRAGQYNLLLGAGISLDSYNANGNLPGTNDFRLDLCKLKSARDSSSLQRVFSTLTGEEVTKFVQPRFEKSIAGPSLKSLTKFLWRRIFTFNIDDALENAYSAMNSAQLLQVYNFDDNYAETGSLLEVPVIHLHGWTGAPHKGYVFPIPNMSGKQRL